MNVSSRMKLVASYSVACLLHGLYPYFNVLTNGTKQFAKYGFCRIFIAKSRNILVLIL